MNKSNYETNTYKRPAVLATAILGLGAGSSAFADLPAVIGTELTAVQTDALAAIDLVWPVVMAVLGGFIILKIVKRAANKI